MKRQWVAAAAAVVAVVVGTSVAIAQSGGEAAAPAPSPVVTAASPADVALVAKIAGRAAHFDGVRSSDDITKFLPNFKYRYPDGTVRSMDLVVRGSVVRVEPGAGFMNRPEQFHGEDLKSDTTMVAYDDPPADFRTVHLVVKVLEEIGDSDRIAPTEIRVGLVHDRPIDLAALARGFQAADSFIFFLYDGGAVYSYDPAVWAIAGNATLLTRVETDGHLSLPGLDPKVAKGVLRKAGTLAQLKEFAGKPDEIREAPKPRGLA